MLKGDALRHWDIRASFVIRHPCFVILNNASTYHDGLICSLILAPKRGLIVLYHGR